MQKLECETIVKHGYIVTMDPERTIYPNGAIAINGQRIVAVGHVDDVVSAWRARSSIDATDCVVIPGLIDGHNHPIQFLSKGIGDDVEIFSWLRNIFAYEAQLTAEEAYVGGLGNFAEMVRSGTTCFNDPGSYYPDKIGEAAMTIGIRGIVSRSTIDLPDPSIQFPKKLVEGFDAIVTQAEYSVKRWKEAGNGRVRAWYSLRHSMSVTDELAIEIKRLSTRDNCGIHCHAATGEFENDNALKRFGKRSLERLYDLGLFAPNLYLAHMGAANEREIDLLAKHDVKVTHCPSASMFGAYGVIRNGKIPRMIERGVTVSLGTDSATAGRFLDMVRCMYLAACAHRDAHEDADIMGAHKALEMATIDGARACLWEDEIGSLEAGKLADITIISMDDIGWKPCLDPIRSLVYTANGTSVDTVIVAGQIIMRHRELTTVDEKWLSRELIKIGANPIKRAGIEIKREWPKRGARAKPVDAGHESIARN